MERGKVLHTWTEKTPPDNPAVGEAKAALLVIKSALALNIKRIFVEGKLLDCILKKKCKIVPHSFTYLQLVPRGTKARTYLCFCLPQGVFSYFLTPWS